MKKYKSLAIKHYINAAGDYLGGYGGIQDDEDDVTTARYATPSDPGAIEVPTPPAHGKDTWDGTAWIPATPETEVERKTRKRKYFEENEMLYAILKMLAAQQAKPLAAIMTELEVEL